MDRHPKIGDIIVWDPSETKRWMLVISEPKAFTGGHYGGRPPTHIVKVYLFNFNKISEFLFDFKELKEGVALVSELD